MNKAEAYDKRRMTLEMNKEKHSNMLIKNVVLKIQENKLNNKVKDDFKMLYVEAKWYKNFVLDFLEKGNDLKDFDTKIKTITHKDKDKNDVEVKLTHLRSQMRSGIVDWIQYSLKSLHAKKLKGQKVGKLKHCKYVKAIPLKQYIKTFYFNENYTRIHIQGIKGTLRINGGEQLKNIKGDFDIQCAKLVRTAEGYFIHVTVYVEKDESITRTSEEIGIDYGIKDAFTFSNGKKIKSTVDLKLIEKIKRKHRELSRKVKGSKNWYKTKHQLNKLYNKLDNIKEDKANKLVHELKNHKTVLMQDEQLKNWKRSYGKRMQHEILGRVKSKTKKLDNCHVLNKWLPTTQLCPKCFSKHKMPLSERTYTCECGYTNDRDIHAANNMILIYHLINDKETPEELREVPMDRLNDFKSKWGLKLFRPS